jgi:RNA polymerase sigma factor (sigma-70 family)
MSSAGSISHWIRELKDGDHQAARRLWENYYQRLVRLAYARLKDLPRRAADEEDVALSAFDSFCRGAEQGRFPRLDDRDDLWQLLCVITVRKATDLTRHEHRQKRAPAVGPADATVLAQVVDGAPTPEFAALLAEQYQRLLEALDDDELRTLAVWKTEGWTNEEIAARLGCVTRTVERKLRLIRTIWEQELADGTEPARD